MIKNERAYVITKAAAERFRSDIAAAERDGPPKGVQPKLHGATIAGMRSQLADLEAELAAYDKMKSANGKKKLDGRLEDFGTLLISARIARGWTQKQLGERLGLKMQQIQQYEATGYESASLTRIRDVCRALGMMVNIVGQLIALPAGAPKDLLKRTSLVSKDA